MAGFFLLTAGSGMTCSFSSLASLLTVSLFFLPSLSADLRLTVLSVLAACLASYLARPCSTRTISASLDTAGPVPERCENLFGLNLNLSLGDPGPGAVPRSVPALNCFGFPILGGPTLSLGGDGRFAGERECGAKDAVDPATEEWSTAPRATRASSLLLGVNLKRELGSGGVDLADAWRDGFGSWTVFLDESAMVLVLVRVDISMWFS